MPVLIEASIVQIRGPSAETNEAGVSAVILTIASVMTTRWIEKHQAQGRALDDHETLPYRSIFWSYVWHRLAVNGQAIAMSKMIGVGAKTSSASREISKSGTGWPDRQRAVLTRP